MLMGPEAQLMTSKIGAGGIIRDSNGRCLAEWFYVQYWSGSNS